MENAEIRLEKDFYNDLSKLEKNQSRSVNYEFC